MTFIRKHGGAHPKPTKEYRAWTSMRQRCTNPHNDSYADYGARGIRVCQQWDDYLQFLEDVGRAPGPEYSLERIDVYGDYEPGNVTWATIKEQALNKRWNHHLTLDGETLTIQEWSEKLGILRVTIHKRLKLGWSVERTLTTPTKRP